MIIALDYDGTFTEDPGLWMRFIEAATKRGHTVICATMRHEHEAQNVIATLHGTQVICTGRKAKRPFLQAMGIDPQVWIDDTPAWIYQDSL